MKRKNIVRNRPKEPKSVAQSQRVGAYMPHEDGRKSRCNEGTMITNLSSHIAQLISKASRKISPTLERTRRDQSACGSTMLNAIRLQYTAAYGPLARLAIKYFSNTLPL